MILINELMQKHKEEAWRDRYQMTTDETLVFYRSMLESERVIPYIINNELLGYVEFTRINYAQLGYIMCQERFFPELYDQQGEIIFIVDLWTKPDANVGLNLIRHFKEQIMQRMSHVSYMVGQHQGKRHKPFAIHKIKQGEI